MVAFRGQKPELNQSARVRAAAYATQVEISVTDSLHQALVSGAHVRGSAGCRREIIGRKGEQCGFHNSAMVGCWRHHRYLAHRRNEELHSCAGGMEIDVQQAVHLGGGA